jgi:hypothetical protein
MHGITDDELEERYGLNGVNGEDVGMDSPSMSAQVPTRSCQQPSSK